MAVNELKSGIRHTTLAPEMLPVIIEFSDYAHPNLMNAIRGEIMKQTAVQPTLPGFEKYGEEESEGEVPAHEAKRVRAAILTALGNNGFDIVIERAAFKFVRKP